MVYFGFFGASWSVFFVDIVLPVHKKLVSHSSDFSPKFCRCICALIDDEARNRLLRPGVLHSSLFMVQPKAAFIDYFQECAAWYPVMAIFKAISNFGWEFRLVC